MDPTSNGPQTNIPWIIQEIQGQGVNETLYNQPTNRLTGRDAIAAAMARHDAKTKDAPPPQTFDAKSVIGHADKSGFEQGGQ